MTATEREILKDMNAIAREYQRKGWRWCFGVGLRRLEVSWDSLKRIDSTGGFKVIARDYDTGVKGVLFIFLAKTEERGWKVKQAEFCPAKVREAEAVL